MPYKPSLLTALSADFEDAARKYMEARDRDATEAEHYLYRMKLIGKDMGYTVRLMDGTIGKIPLSVCKSGQKYTAVSAGLTAQRVIKALCRAAANF